MFARKTTTLCKQKPHGKYCVQHSRYNKYLSDYTVEQIRDFPKCTECKMQFLPKERHWKVCKECQDTQHRPYCAWYSRREVTEALSNAPEKCPWRALPDKILCARHSDVNPDWLQKPTKYCSGCKKPYPIEIYNNKTCPNCCRRSKTSNIILQEKQKSIDLTKDHKCFTCDTVVPGVDDQKYCIRCVLKRRINDAENDHKFYLTDEEAKKIMLSTCTYCKVPDFYVNSMDRVDSSKEYVRDNVVAACDVCNKMKSDKNVEKYLKMCHHISHYLKTGEQLYPDLFEAKETAPKYRIYAKSAKDRGHAFDLTLTEFQSFLGKRCTYCGNGVNIGIDRVDSTKSYTVDNCVPCCKACNEFKKHFLQTDFIDKTHRVAENISAIREFLQKVTKKTTITIKRKFPELSAATRKTTITIKKKFPELTA